MLKMPPPPTTLACPREWAPIVSDLTEPDSVHALGLARRVFVGIVLECVVVLMIWAWAVLLNR